MGVGGGVEDAEPTTVCIGKVLLTTEMEVMLMKQEKGWCTLHSSTMTWKASSLV